MDKAEAARQARLLLRGARAGALATQRDGQPFASLVTPAMAPDLSPLLWLSRLAEHTRQLLQEPRCALIVQGGSVSENPQTSPRVTVTGVAEQVSADETEALKARWLALHPYAALYAGFTDFTLWRIRPAAVLLVGGFAAAARMPAREVLPDPAAVAAIAAEEAAILQETHQDQGDSGRALAEGLLRQPPGEWRLVALDTDGCDLVSGERRCRLDFPAPVPDAAGMRRALGEAVRSGRAALGG